MTEQKKPKAKPLRYFFYHGELHKKIHINKGNDTIIAWNYPQHKAVKHVYSDVRKNGEKAFSTIQVCQMVGRKRKVIFEAIRDGKIERPQITYNYNGMGEEHAYYWSEADIMGLHDYLKTVHIGRPRKDGEVTTGKNLPSASELRAMIRQGTVLYVRTDSGEFVPTWQAEKF